MNARSRPAHPRVASARAVHGLGLGVALLLALSCNEVGAAALGRMTTSVGLLAALATLFVIKGWPAHVPASALSAAGGMLLVAGAGAWLWRARALERVIGLTAATTGRQAARPGAAACPARAAAAIVLPAGFERESLLTELRLHFVQLQAAWDAGALPALQALTTPDMLEELRGDWPCCTTGAAGPGPNRTDVVTLQADLLGFEQLAGDFLASVEFSGLIRESAEHGAAPFRELWMFARARQGAAGWRLARYQALL